VIRQCDDISGFCFIDPRFKRRPSNPEKCLPDKTTQFSQLAMHFKNNNIRQPVCKVIMTFQTWMNAIQQTNKLVVTRTLFVRTKMEASAAAGDGFTCSGKNMHYALNYDLWIANFLQNLYWITIVLEKSRKAL